MIKLNVNGQAKAVEANPATPILWVVRENLGMTGNAAIASRARS